MNKKPIFQTAFEQVEGLKYGANRYSVVYSETDSSASENFTLATLIINFPWAHETVESFQFGLISDEENRTVRIFNKSKVGKDIKFELDGKEYNLPKIGFSDPKWLDRPDGGDDAEFYVDFVEPDAETLWKFLEALAATCKATYEADKAAAADKVKRYQEFLAADPINDVK